MYRYGVKNTYRPSILAPNAYGWARGAGYASADVPTAWVENFGGGMNSDQLKQQFAYEWFQSGSTDSQGWRASQSWSNPPFVSGAAGRLHPLLLSGAAGGGPARILRGYIRRAEYESGDNLSRTRLYFMYNPEVITRDYVSYLEQGALDPFNTVYQSGNLIAPPSIMSFSFELFFDRQEEATQIDHPGVFVDYQFFDMVVRNVIPSDPNQTSNTLPDSGVMMVNPRDITIVFSPQITVQGRPTNAQVTFEKFTHRMVPTRMRIRLTILASYFGPVRDMVEYKKEELPAELSIPLDEFPATPFEITHLAVEDDADAAAGIPGGTTGPVNYSGQLGQAGDANHAIRLQALQWCYDNVNQGGPGNKGVMDAGWTNYNNSLSGNLRFNLPSSADCSGLVTEAYCKIGHGGTLGWTGHPGTSSIMGAASGKKNVMVYTPLSSLDWRKDLMPGDILIRDGHVGFFVKYMDNTPSGCRVFDASSTTSRPEVGERPLVGVGRFTHLIRPTPLGSVGSASTASSYNTAAFRWGLPQ